MFLFFVIALLTLSYLWLRNRYSYWERRGVPGPKPVYIFGNLLKQLTFQEHISLAHKRWHNTYNNVPYLGFYKLLEPAVMIRDPELQREILVKAFMNFHQNDVTISKDDELLRANPFFASGEEWRQSRAMFGTFFSANKIKTVFPAMLNVGNEWEQYVRSLDANSEIDGKDICRRFTTETMLRCTFSIDGKSFEPQSEFLDMGQSVFNPDMITAMKAMTAFFIPAIQKFVNVAMSFAHGNTAGQSAGQSAAPFPNAGHIQPGHPNNPFNSFHHPACAGVPSQSFVPQGNRNRKRRAQNSANKPDDRMKIDRVQLLEQQMANMIKEKEEAAKAAKDLALAAEQRKIEETKAELARREDDLAKREAALLQERTIFEAERAKWNQERAQFEEAKKNAEAGKAVPWYRRSLF